MNRRTSTAPASAPLYGAFLLVVSLVSLLLVALPSAARAQTFKVQKWNIGGEGGTDYVNAEPGTGRVFVSRSSFATARDIFMSARSSIVNRRPAAPRFSTPVICA